MLGKKVEEGSVKSFVIEVKLVEFSYFELKDTDRNKKENVRYLDVFWKRANSMCVRSSTRRRVTCVGSSESGGRRPARRSSCHSLPVSRLLQTETLRTTQNRPVGHDSGFSLLEHIWWLIFVETTEVRCYPNKKLGKMIIKLKRKEIIVLQYNANKH